MTTIAVLADPPVADCAPAVLPSTVGSEKQVEFYRAMLADVCNTIQHGEGKLLVNYPPSASVPEDVDPEQSLREFLDAELTASGEVRYEVQVGESYAGRVGNTLTHLLESEGLESVAVAEPTAIFLRREHIGTTAMQLRSSDVVLGPAPDGRVSFAAFGEPLDFTEVYESPAVETFTARAREADLDVSFLPLTPLLDGPADLSTAISLLRARKRAGRLVPVRTTARVEELGLHADGTIEQS